MKKNKNAKIAGFTLIELLVVVGIIVVLATVGLVSYRSANQGARDSKRKADIEAVRQALVLYKQENTLYPQPSETDQLLRFTSVVGTLVNNGFLSAPGPSDPTRYAYTRKDSGQGFCVCATLEGTNNKGNATTSSGSCTITGSGNFYCAKNP